MATLYDRSYRNLNLKEYSAYLPPIDFGPIRLKCPYDRQYILRMMVKGLDGLVFHIPRELKWLEDTIHHCHENQIANDVFHQFVYVTVRHGLVTSVTDDDWHVDGFAMRYAHPPEQNYIYSNCHSTEILQQKFKFPDDFDPMIHHIHQYFKDHADDSKKIQLPPNRFFIIDPYIVHRRPKNLDGARTFVRISFVPIEIEDDTCQINPLMPARRYGREDMRKTLLRYQGNSNV